MAITVNSAGVSHGMPSAPLRATSVNVDLDNSYPEGGYEIVALRGQTVVHSDFVPHYDAAELRWFRLENPSDGVVNLVAYDTANGAPGTETDAGDDMTGHAGLVVGAILE
jgi:hypothetical protein